MGILVLIRAVRTKRHEVAARGGEKQRPDKRIKRGKKKDEQSCTMRQRSTRSREWFGVILGASPCCLPAVERVVFDRNGALDDLHADDLGHPLVLHQSLARVGERGVVREVHVVGRAFASERVVALAACVVGCAIASRARRSARLGLLRV